LNQVGKTGGRRDPIRKVVIANRLDVSVSDIDPLHRDSPPEEIKQPGRPESAGQ
jgi:hypothetical protein